MSSIEIYASNNYFTTSQYQNDKCLCGQFVSNTDKDCRDVLQDKCFQNIIGQDTETQKLFEKLIQDCKTDFAVSFLVIF